MYILKKLFENFNFVFKNSRKSFCTEFFSSGVLKTMFFLRVDQKQISSDVIYLYFIHLKILLWILKAFDSFCLRWNIYNQINN